MEWHARLVTQWFQDINANVNLNGGRRPAATPVAQADVDAKVGSHPDKQRVKSHEHDHEDDDTEDGSVLDADAKLRLGNVADANVKAKVSFLHCTQKVLVIYEVHLWNNPRSEVETATTMTTEAILQMSRRRPRWETWLMLMDTLRYPFGLSS